MAAAPIRPATPGTGFPSLHLEDVKRNTYTLLETSFHTFFGPIPMIEKSSRPPLVLATALPETAAGMLGIFGSSADSGPRHTANTKNESNKKEWIVFFIAESVRLWQFPAKQDARFDCP